MEEETEIEVAKRLRLKLLKRWEAMLDMGELPATDAATIARLLSQNGWVLDETRLPSRLKDKLTGEFDPTIVDDMDGVVPIRAKGGVAQ